MRRHVLRLLVISVAVVMAGVMTAPALAEQQTNTAKQAAASANRPTSVDLDELENNPEKYIGKIVTVEGEVDKVLGPHLFTVDERDWADPEREMPVVVAEPFAAIVRSDTPVRITGTVKKVPLAQIEREHAFLGDPKIKAEIETKPVIVANEITATQSGVSLQIRAEMPVGTSGGDTSAAVTDPNQVADAKDKNLVGRRVDLTGVTVGTTSDRGFWVQTPSGERIFVMAPGQASAKQGQRVDIKGLVLELPEGLRVQVNAANEPIYIFAERVTAR